MNSLVSVVMPMYNSEKTIAESIESVTKQTYRDFELIVVDDDSSDSSYEIVKSIADIEPKVIVIKNHHTKGASGARQTAIDVAKGGYIAFLDSDDIWHPEKLEKSIQFMEKHDYAFIYTDYYIFKNKLTDFYGFKYETPNSISYNDLLKYCPIGCLTVVLKEDIIRGVTFRDYPKEDYLYWLDILRNDHKAHRLPQALSFYRTGHQSISSNKFKEIKRQFYIIHHLHDISILRSFLCIAIYAINGIIKNININLSWR